MEQGWFERLTAIMVRMADGDEAAWGDLYISFGRHIRSAVAFEFDRLGVRRVDPDDIHGLAVEFCIDLSRRAGSWDPSCGATPWRWAARRIRALVVAFIGSFTDPFPEGGLPDRPATAVSAETDDDVLDTLDGLGRRLPIVGLLQEALDRVSRRSQQAVLFEAKMQDGQGDPSPAVTIGRARGMRPDAVRQSNKRVLDRVNRLVDTEPHFAPLADLPLLRRAA